MLFRSSTQCTTAEAQDKPFGLFGESALQHPAAGPGIDSLYPDLPDLELDLDYTTDERASSGATQLEPLSPTRAPNTTASNDAAARCSEDYLEHAQKTLLNRKLLWACAAISGLVLVTVLVLVLVVFSSSGESSGEPALLTDPTNSSGSPTEQLASLRSLSWRFAEISKFVFDAPAVNSAFITATANIALVPNEAIIITSVASARRQAGCVVTFDVLSALRSYENLVLSTHLAGASSSSALAQQFSASLTLLGLSEPTMAKLEVLRGPSVAPQPTPSPTDRSPTFSRTEPPTESPSTLSPTTVGDTYSPTTEAPTTEAPTTEAPTTEAPTTEAPTTEAPTADQEFPCTVGVACSVPAGVYRLEQPTSSALHRLSGAIADADTLVPFARSYNGHSWELYMSSEASYSGRGVSAIPPALGCPTSSLCTVTISNQALYQLDSLTASDPVADALASRFLEKTTFGATTASMQALGAAISSKGAHNALEQWLVDQVNTEATYHREYYRQRVNPRVVVSIPLGSVRTACDIGSRWHNYALTTADVGRVITIIEGTSQDPPFTGKGIFVDGTFRTEIASTFAEDSARKPYTICAVDEAVGGDVTVGNDCSIVMPNPQTKFTTVDSSNTWDLATSDASFTEVAGMPGVKVLDVLNVACSTPYSFIKYSGSTFRFDPRLQLLQNTLDSPATGSASLSTNGCPVVPKTFLNKASCVRQTTCTPVTFSSAPIMLTEATLKLYYSTSNKYVYRISGLRLEDSYDATPCSGPSRWRKVGAVCSSETALDAATKATLANALRSSTDMNLYVRDIQVSSGTCNSLVGGVSATGSQVQVDANCWEHSHPELYNVHDFSAWTVTHKGNEDVFAQGKPNPITAFAQADGFDLAYPASHPMSRWKKYDKTFPKLGRFGDTLDFASLPSEAQTLQMALQVGSVGSQAGLGVETCGSPGEVANVPEDGHRYKMWMVFKTESAAFEGWTNGKRYDVDNGQRTTWTTIALNANDQFRQRVSWALSQIFVVGESGFPKKDQSETWHNYYDIFVRNAFGNFRDILQQVSWSPLMASYLTFLQNQGLQYSGTFPDENYAREIMQLFSIGLDRLNIDGTPMRDSNGDKIPTYDNDDIMTFARAWTGFDRQAFRSNIEAFTGSGSNNWIDPMLIKPEWRDALPKMDTLDGYIGDRVPLCAALPARSFLRTGATFEYLGEQPSDEHIELAEAGSSLYDALCKASSSTCTFPSTVVLNANLMCHGIECDVDTVRNVKLMPSTGETVYYQYKPAACVKLAFFEGNQASDKNGNKLCAHPQTALASAGCCDKNSRITEIIGQCKYPNERVTYNTLEGRCAAESNKQICGAITTREANGCNIGGLLEYGWTRETCAVQAQVDTRGFVSIVHSHNSGEDYLNRNTAYSFQVPWQNGAFPKVPEGCAAGCVTQDDTCVCNVLTSDVAVHTDSSALPSLAELEALLSVGSAAPEQFDNGVYSKCTTSVCTSVSGVEIYLKASTLDLDTIFKIATARGGTVYFKNQVSTVTIGRFSFRNPPHFMTFSEPTVQQAESETEAVIDHFFEHPNTAPFISHMLIQRMTTSNPSPRYVKVVAEAFTSGVYGGKAYSGEYGDLQATVAAILLDREASSPILDADPAAGKLREPLIKVLHLMRAMDYTLLNGRQEVELAEMEDKVGQMYALSPSVFNYYLPDFTTGAVASAKLSSPEAQLGTAPLLVGFLNGATSLIKYGLTECHEGFGTDKYRSRSGNNRCANDPSYNADGRLAYTPTATTAGGVVAQLDLLLTAGRLNSHTTQVIADAYASAAATGTAAARQEALQVALQLMMTSAEFHSTNFNKLTVSLRPPKVTVASGGRQYKAVVVIYMNGGADSFNMLVPHTCTGHTHDLYAEYASLRGSLAINKCTTNMCASSDLLEIDIPEGNQPCEKFGLHPSMSVIKSLYDNGEATFIANVGALVEPVSKHEYQSKSKELPPSLFSHNFMTKFAHNVHAQSGAAKGVVGRMNDELASASRAVPFKTAAYSIDGNVKILEGDQAPAVVDKKNGVTAYMAHAELTDTIKDLLTTQRSESYFSDTYASLMQSALDETDTLSSSLESSTLSTSFADDNLSKRLEQVSKLTKTRGDTERAGFFVSLGGWDSHSAAADILTSNLDAVDAALSSFVTEMKDQGIWDDVTIVTMSEFGRTLTSNGLGNDHGWGGNHVVMGGSVDGKRILGKYPSALGEESDVNIGRGRILPTVGWESVWYGLAEWMGVDDIDTVLPNAGRFAPSQLFGKEKLFK